MTRLQGGWFDRAAGAASVGDGLGIEMRFCVVCEFVGVETQATQSPIAKSMMAKNGFIICS
jgi:hypothetical protein